MRILYHHRTQGKGAEGVHIREIVNALKEQGNEVIVVSPPGVDAMAEKVRADAGGRDNDSLKRLWKTASKCAPEIIFELMEIGYNLVALFTINRIIQQNGIEAIYERYHFFGFAGVLQAKKHMIPLILEVNEVSGIKRVRGQLLTSLTKNIEKKVFKNADGIIVVSDFLKQHIADLGVDKSKIHVIPNAVNPAVFDPDSTDSKALEKKYNPTQSLIIGFVGGFVKWHNFELLFKAFEEIIGKGGHDIRMVLVGDGPLKNELNLMARQRNIEKYLIFTGSVNHAEIPAYIKMMDICVIPHSNEFRSPIKMFEYMAMGKPVIAPRLKPVEAVIQDGYNGIIFEADNKESLVKCFIDVIDDDKKRQSIGGEARKTILSKHLWTHNAQRVCDIFMSLKK